MKKCASLGEVSRKDAKAQRGERGEGFSRRHREHGGGEGSARMREWGESEEEVRECASVRMREWGERFKGLKVEGRRDLKDFKDVKVFMMMGSPFNLHSSFLLSSLR